MTPDDVLQQLIAEAEAELASLREGVVLQEKYLAALRARSGRRTAMSVANDPRTAATIADDAVFIIPRLSIPEHTLAVLQEAKRPMRAKDIADALERRGVKSTAQKGLLPGVLTALQRRTDLFVKKDRGVYGLVEWEDGS
jgi:hypothetical protein